jgi:hypothetical protein
MYYCKYRIVVVDSSNGNRAGMQEMLLQLQQLFYRQFITNNMENIQDDDVQVKCC